MTPKLLMTRPLEQSDRFVAALRDVVSLPFDVITSPLLKIVPMEVSDFDHDPDHVIFTSANAVKQADRLGLTRSAIAWCVGDRTTDAARQAGYTARSANGAGRELLALIQAEQPKGTMLHVHGCHTYMRFEEELGNQCQGICAYDQVAQRLTHAAKDALMGTEPVIVPLFSVRTATILSQRTVMIAPTWLIGISAQVAESMRKIDCQIGLKISNSPDQQGMVDATRSVFDSLSDIEVP